MGLCEARRQKARRKPRLFLRQASPGRQAVSRSAVGDYGGRLQLSIAFAACVAFSAARGGRGCLVFVKKKNQYKYKTPPSLNTGLNQSSSGDRGCSRRRATDRHLPFPLGFIDKVIDNVPHSFSLPLKLEYEILMSVVIMPLPLLV